MGIVDSGANGGLLYSLRTHLMSIIVSIWSSPSVTVAGGEPVLLRVEQSSNNLVHFIQTVGKPFMLAAPV